ncbi:MAG TPA: histidine kinase dimerization/phospho-acceptor domain-containing protein, partial [Paenirhodobacter sp.]
MSAPSPRSLRRDLAVGLSLGLVVFWLLAMAAAAYVLHEEMGEIFDAVLRQTAERILPLAEIGHIEASDPTLLQPVSADGSRSTAQLTWVLRDQTGAIVLLSDRASPAIFAQPLAAGFHTANDHRIFALIPGTGSYRIEVAEALSYRREAVRETMVALLLPLLLLLPASLFGIAWFTRARLRPVTVLSDEVATRGAADLSPLITPGLQAELIPIRAGVDRLMAQLARTLEAERSFTANAAHELRTPMAALLAQTQRLMAETPEGPLRQRARTIEAELKRLARLAEKLLHLSRAEASGVLLAASAQDMVPVLVLVAG